MLFSVNMFLSKPSGVGIALHGSELEIAHLPGGRQEAMEQMRFERIPFLPEQYENGRVNDLNQFAGRVAQVFDRIGLPRQNVTLALPSSVTVLRTIMVPKMKKHKLRDVIQFQIGKEIHLPFANPVFDFDFLPASQNTSSEAEYSGLGNEKQASRNISENEVPVLLVAVPGEVVNGLMDAFEQANVELSTVEVKGLSIFRALKAIGRKPSGNLAILEFGVDRIEAHFYQRGTLVFTRTLELVPERYIASASSAIAVQEEEMVPQVSKPQDGPALNNAWVILEKLEMKDRFEKMVAELSFQVERFINFFEHSLRQGSEQTVHHLWITGMVPAPQRLLKLLTERLEVMNIQYVHIPYFVHRTTLFQNGESGKDVLFSLSAAGAALKGVVSDAD